MNLKKNGLLAAAALVAAIAAISATYAFYFSYKTPSLSEVRRGIIDLLPEGSSIVDMNYAVFSDSRSSGRVNVVGSFSLATDFYSSSGAPRMLLSALSSDGITEAQLNQWWSENSGQYPEFRGRLVEYDRLYARGQKLDFRGDLYYWAQVDGVSVSSMGLQTLDFPRIQGSARPDGGYLADPQTVRELRAEILTWRSQRPMEVMVDFPPSHRTDEPFNDRRVARMMLHDILVVRPSRIHEWGGVPFVTEPQNYYTCTSLNHPRLNDFSGDIFGWIWQGDHYRLTMTESAQQYFSQFDDTFEVVFHEQIRTTMCPRTFELR